MKVQVCPRSNLGRFALALALALTVPSLAKATPSTTFWAPSTPFVQPYGLLHITYDTYFLGSALYPVDTGLEMGVLPFDKFQMEAGFDFLYPTQDPSKAPKVKGLALPLLLNAKVGSPEGAFGDWSPGWSAGIFGVGFEDDVTDYNIVHFMLGKTFPVIGNPEVGFYYGLNDKLLIDKNGDKEQFGVMVGWFSPAIELKKPYMDKVILAADIQTGKNGFGAAGGGVYLYFTPTISLLTGPVFFLEKDVQAPVALFGADKTGALVAADKPGMVWTMQLDIDMDLFTKKAE
ncbi:MAG: hypothetical protein HYY13_10375 [Nitrospirae bacterium]|nr:hypothetical protein [Nitrospirota bacterium]